MKHIIILLIFLFTISFSSCFLHNSNEYLLICGAYAVPGMFYPDLKGSEASCKVIETDDYGRTLFLYSAPSVISDKNETVAVICQKNTKESVYFYPDYCFDITKNSVDDFSKLKEKNDWNKPLNESKMSFRKKKVSFDGIILQDKDIDMKEIEDTCCNHFGVSANSIVELSFDDLTPDGTIVFFAEIKLNEKISKYFLRFYETGTSSIYCISEPIVHQSY